MSEGRMGRRVETVERPLPVAPAPQWQNLFLAPAYHGVIAEVIEADWEQEMTAPAALRRRPGDRRAARPAA
ncbi:MULTISPECIES: hypothetical protein [unclassified Streptomyces]|uniref:hypothetical protein n=1 Tax=unclassified Streptomyces TaxID=2593676 RepID=UPI003248F04C